MNSIDRRSLRQVGPLPRGLDSRRLLDLRQMLEVCATEYLRIGSAIQSFCGTLAVDIGLDEPLSQTALESITQALSNIMACSQELGLQVCFG